MAIPGHAEFSLYITDIYTHITLVLKESFERALFIGTKNLTLMMIYLIYTYTRITFLFSMDPVNGYSLEY